jgi:monoamine oxidase
MHYNTIIVGGGIAGLTIAHALGSQALLLERYPAVGGRAVTYRDDGLQYEIGAGRIFKQHARVAELVKRYKLTTFPIGADSTYNGEDNDFLELFVPLRNLLESLPPKNRATHTIAELIPVVYHPVFKMYPYWAELNMLRADMALPLFKRTETMGTTSATDFYGITEGIDTLTTRLADDAKATGATLKNRHRVHDVKRSGTLFEVKGDYGKKAEAKPFKFTCDRIILATCRCSLSQFSVLKGAPLLKQLGTSPLTRIYAVYPKNADGKVWFHTMKKTIVDNPLRYIIPINSDSGLIMISYTDGPDAEYWENYPTDTELQTEIQAHVRASFPTLSIPEPTFLKKHYWAGGCTYWLPGDYDVESASRAAHNPAPNVYVVGESISTEQAWLEGALQSAETLLSMLE